MPASTEPDTNPLLRAANWARQNLFASPGDVLLTLFGLFLIWQLLLPLLDWALVNASWRGADSSACLNDAQGACWAFVANKWEQFVYGRYPEGEIWRVNLVYAAGAAALAPLLVPAAPYKWINAAFLFLVYPAAAFILLTGGIFGLAPVETSLWGGLLVTLVVAVVGITFSLPFGILLALGRRSRMPVVRMLSIAFIEFWRGIPLITVLFMASVMLPFFLREGGNLDELLRCLIGVALFSSAYMAEVIRGGLQAIPRGQYEAARALGLGYWRMMGLIVLPQALKYTIPGIVNTFIGLFKDTTLVSIVGLFDLLGIVQFHFSDPQWASPQTHYTGYAFAGLIFWAFCFGMSRYSIFMERRLATGHGAAGELR